MHQIKKCIKNKIYREGQVRRVYMSKSRFSLYYIFQPTFEEHQNVLQINNSSLLFK